jgi:hypothetical protein
MRERDRTDISGRWFISGFTAPSFLPFLIALTGALAMVVISVFLKFAYVDVIAIRWPKPALEKTFAISCKNSGSVS